MATAFNILIPATILITFGILCFGVFALFRGGDFGRSWSNRAMRMRVAAQFVAIVVLVAAMWAHQQGYF
ncbi:MAG: twin transmembrane helix small protein [Hyphomonadaceae bacterium]|nr:twin transmembrane helix small protein [Hyphomonadaceae bacterium]